MPTGLKPAPVPRPGKPGAGDTIAMRTIMFSSKATIPNPHKIGRTALCGWLALLGHAAGAGAGQVTLSWDANTESTLGGYKLYYGTSSGNYTANVDVGKATTYTLNNLADGATYYIAAQAYDTGRTVQSGYSNQVAYVAAPAAQIAANPASGSAKAGQAVTFTDTSQGSVTSRSWNLGNGVTSTAQSASTNYSAAGTYTVTLKVTGPGGSNTATQSYVVKAAQVAAPVANFTATPATGAAPLPVSFTDTSTGSPTAWSWSFGDGGTATVASPSHTYAAAGTYTVTLTARNASGSSNKTGTVTVTGSSSGGSGGGANGLVAAYGFEEPAGNTAQDSSGLNNHGAISTATRTNNGKFGRALSFNGTNAWVSVNDAASLDLTSGMTLEAWVYPQAAMSGVSSVLNKESGSGSAYGLFANAATNQAAAGILTSTWWQLPGGTSLPATTWKHLAATYDGSLLKFYVDANPVAQGAVNGAIQVSNGALRIGGHSILGDYFAGRIDEVRLYNRALSQAEIAADRNKPILNSLWKASTVPANPTTPADTSPVELGLKFKSDVAGTITGLRFYKGTTNTGTHVATLWSASGQQLARATFSGETASGWQQVNFATPVKIAANTVYVASYHTNVGQYAHNTGFFAAAGYDSVPLHALGGSGNANGVYRYSATPAFPNSSYQSTNYWVDVVFKP